MSCRFVHLTRTPTRRGRRSVRTVRLGRRTPLIRPRVVRYSVRAIHDQVKYLLFEGSPKNLINEWLPPRLTPSVRYIHFCAHFETVPSRPIPMQFSGKIGQTRSIPVGSLPSAVLTVGEGGVVFPGGMGVCFPGGCIPVCTEADIPPWTE